MRLPLFIKRLLPSPAQEGVTVWIGPKILSDIKACQALIPDRTSLAVILISAISFFKWALQMMKQGRKIVAIDDDGVSEVGMPSSPNNDPDLIEEFLKTL